MTSRYFLPCAVSLGMIAISSVHSGVAAEASFDYDVQCQTGSEVNHQPYSCHKARLTLHNDTGQMVIAVSNSPKSPEYDLILEGKKVPGKSDIYIDKVIYQSKELESAAGLCSLIIGKKHFSASCDARTDRPILHVICDGTPLQRGR